MNILLCHRVGGAYGFITDGFISALIDMGHNVQRWDGDEKSWNSFNPSLYIGCSGHRQSIPNNRGNCKVAIHVNPYGPINIPGINENQDAINWVLKIKADIVYGYGSKEYEHYWSYWQKRHGIPWFPMPTAADVKVFHKLNQKKKYDLVYLGGYWDYKGKTINKYLLPLLKSGLTYKVHGWGNWPNNISSGELQSSEVNEFLNSGKIGPCISEQHTHDYHIDIPERAFKVAACGALIVHDNTQAIKHLVPSALVANNPTEFIDICKHYIIHDDEREILVEKQRQEVLLTNTYHNRVGGLLARMFEQA